MAKKLNAPTKVAAVVDAPKVQNKNVVKKTASKEFLSLTNSKNAIKTTRTKLIQMLNESKGRIFSSVHVGVDGKDHLTNGMRYKKQDNPHGHIKVYSIKNREMRLVNPQTLYALSTGHQTFVAPKPKLVRLT